MYRLPLHDFLEKTKLERQRTDRGCRGLGGERRLMAKRHKDTLGDRSVSGL